MRRTPRPVLQTRTWHAPGFGYYTPLAYPGYFYGPPWGLHQYGPWGPYPYYGGYYYRERGSVRLQVKPVETEVYVDGYYAGVVDSYDGFFQRLSLPPGQHDIELRLDGYRSIQEQVYLTIGQSYRIEHGMEPLGPGETTPPPPTPRAEPQVEPVLELEPEPFAWPERDRTTLAPATPAGFGDLVVRVQPTAPRSTSTVRSGRPRTARAWSSSSAQDDIASRSGARVTRGTSPTSRCGKARRRR